jgi:enoyl-CoA hydratase/carnithine racemase
MYRDMQHLTLQIDRHVALVRLDRPEKRNAVNLAMFEDFSRCGERLAAEPDLRAVVLAGNGEAFCAGLDLTLFAGMDPDAIAELMAPRSPSPSNTFQLAACIWRELPGPVVCAVHGVAFGAGLQIAMGADLRIAAPDARLSVMEIHWGLVPDMALSVTARGLVAPDALCELALTGRIIDAGEGQRLGLVTRLDDDPLGAACRLAAEIAAQSPDAVRAIKTLFGAGWHEAPEDALALEARLQSALIGTPNQLEAATAKLARRPPQFE